MKKTSITFGRYIEKLYQNWASNIHIQKLSNNLNQRFRSVKFMLKFEMHHGEQV